jgi:hypothetical protein
MTKTHRNGKKYEKYFFEQYVSTKNINNPEIKLFDDVDEEKTDITKYLITDKDEKNEESKEKILQKIEEKKISFMFFQLWMESHKRKYIKNDYYYCLTKEEILKEETRKLLCTEKMDYMSEKISIIRDLEGLLGLNHNDYKKIIEKEDIKNCYEYLMKNKDHIYKIFKMRDYGEKKNKLDENNIQYLKICIQRLNKIFGEFNGNELKGFQFKKQKAVNYKLTPVIDEYNYEYILRNVEEDRERRKKEKELEEEMMREIEKYNQEHFFTNECNSKKMKNRKNTQPNIIIK